MDDLIFTKDLSMRSKSESLSIPREVMSVTVELYSESKISLAKELTEKLKRKISSFINTPNKMISANV